MAKRAPWLTDDRPPPTPGRSRNMAAIRSKDTRPEHALRRALRERGLTGYRCHHRNLPGKPDIAFTRWRVAIFIDGAFWHGHPDHFTFGKLGSYWDEKVRRTQQRDKEQEDALKDAGYDVMRFWDFQVKEDPGRCAVLVRHAINQSRRREAGADAGER
jgi:DNA mismatch endonuclease, patch repair protein